MLQVIKTISDYFVFGNYGLLSNFDLTGLFTSSLEVKQERRTVAELLWDFWSARPPLPVLLALIPALRPRRYSIASARLAKIHKLAVRYEILMVLIQI